MGIEQVNVEDIKSMNIFQKMLAITDEITRVAKNLTVGVGKNQYKGVGEADVLNAVKPLEVKYRVYSYPTHRSIVDTSILTTTSEYDGKTTERKQLFMRIETTYKFVNIDNPTESIEITTYGDGIDSQDKASGKAMTYSDKYALLKAYKIETGDDPDQKASEPLKNVEPTAPKLATAKQIEILSKAYTGENLDKLLKVNNITKLEEITMQKASELIGKLTKGGK